MPEETMRRSTMEPDEVLVAVRVENLLTAL